MIDELFVYVKQIQTELESLRGQSSLYLENSPGRAEVLDRIAVLEKRLAELGEIDIEVGRILASYNVASINGLRALRARHENTVRSTPNKIWQTFRIARGEGSRGERCRTHLLPSDLAQLPEFRVEEDAARAAIKAASEAIGPITEDIKRINALVDNSRNSDQAQRT